MWGKWQSRVPDFCLAVLERNCPPAQHNTGISSIIFHHLLNSKLLVFSHGKDIGRVIFTITWLISAVAVPNLIPHTQYLTKCYRLPTLRLFALWNRLLVWTLTCRNNYFSLQWVSNKQKLIQKYRIYVNKHWGPIQIKEQYSLGPIKLTLHPGQFFLGAKLFITIS